MACFATELSNLADVSKSVPQRLKPLFEGLLARLNPSPSSGLFRSL
jgi:hypothetical protein